MKEIIEWIDARERLPESDTTVLVLVPTSRSEPVWPGYHDGDDWQYAEGTSVDGPVTHWAELPAGPTIAPHRVQLSRRKGWKMPPNTVKVDRTTKFGNPFRPTLHSTDELVVITTPADAVRSFRSYAMDRLNAQPKWLEPLRGKNLACWCGAGQVCHADVLLELANAPTAGGGE